MRDFPEFRSVFGLVLSDCRCIDPTFFPGHAAAIHLRIRGHESVIGVFGILHPTVLEKFELRLAVHRSPLPYTFRSRGIQGAPLTSQ